MLVGDPIALDQYSHFMVAEFDDREVMSIDTGFMSLFGDPRGMSRTIVTPDADSVAIDIVRGNEKAAALIRRGSEARSIGGLQDNTKTQAFSNQKRVFPLIEEEGDISSAQIGRRLAGENPAAIRTRLERTRQLGIEHHREHIRRITRRMEVMAAQSFRTGKMSAITGTTNTSLMYDFQRDSALTYTVATSWDTITAPIMTNLDDGCALVRSKGRTAPDFAIFGADAMDGFLVNTEVLAKADNRRFELIMVSTENPVPAKFDRMVASGFTARGRLRTPAGYELWIFTYLGQYDSDAGVATRFMPDDEVIISSSSARRDRYFGPPDRLPATSGDVQWVQELFGLNISTPLAPALSANLMAAQGVILPGMFYSDGYKGGSNKTATVRTQAAPIFVTTQTDAIAKLTVIF